MADAKVLNLRAKVQAQPGPRAEGGRAGAAAAAGPPRSEGLVGSIKGAMGAQYDTMRPRPPAPDRQRSRLREPGSGEISYRILADAKDAEGKFIGANVEQGHKARSTAPTSRRSRPSGRPIAAFKAGMKRRLSKAARDAVKQSYEKGS
jgi:hypothetical protein